MGAENFKLQTQPAFKQLEVTNANKSGLNLAVIRLENLDRHELILLASPTINKLKHIETSFNGT